MTFNEWCDQHEIFPTELSRRWYETAHRVGQEAMRERAAHVVEAQRYHSDLNPRGEHYLDGLAAKVRALPVE